MTVQRRQDDLADVDRLRRRCDFVAAEEALRAASGNGVEPSSVEIAWGRLELDRDEFREALTRFEEAAALDPRRSDAVGWQVAALSRLCMFDEARAVATGGMRQFPDSAPIGVALARLYLDWERPADALAQFDSVLARHPDDENALEWRIDALRTLHRYADAETAAHEALARHPGSPGILDSLGYVYDDQGRYDDAVACYEEILDRFPDNPVGLRGRVTVLRHAHRYESARTAAAEATERLPGSAQIHVCWSYLDEDRCRYTEALDHLDQALCIQPRCHDALEQRIEVLRKLHRYGEAAAAGQGAEALHPRSPDIIESLAWTCYHQGRYSDALAAFGRALEIHDRHPGALDGRASALRGMCRYAQAEAFISEAAERLPHAARLKLELGFLFDDQGEHAKALGCFDRVLELHPCHAGALSWRVTELRNLRRFAEAEEAARDALERRAEPSIWVAYGWVHADQDRGDDAVAAFERAIELDPFHSSGYQSLTKELVTLQRYDEAESAARGGTELLPHDASLRRELGWVYGAQDLDERALAEFRRALDVDPGDSFSARWVASALRWLHRHAEAETIVREALRTWPDDADLMEQLGWIFMAQHRYADALDQFTQAQANDPAEARTVPRISALRLEGRFAEAETLASSALNRRPDLADLHIELADVYSDQGRHADAETVLRNALRQLPTSADLAVSLIRLYRWLGRYEDALAECDQMLGRQRQSVSALRLRAIALDDLRRYTDEADAIRAAIAIHPANTDFALRLGWLYYSQGHYTEALRDFEKAAAASPSRRARYGQAAALCRLNRHAEAIAVLRAEIEWRPNYSATHVELCETYENQGRYGDALAAAERAVAVDCFSVSAHTALIRILRRMQRLDEAEAVARGAMERMPRSARLLIELGRVCDDRNDYPQALACFDRALELVPIYNIALVAKSRTLRSLRRFAEAERLISAAANRYPLHEFLRVELGWIYRDQGRLMEARRVFEKLRDEAVSPSERADACTGLGWVAFTREDYQEAARYFRDGCGADRLSHDNRLGLAWALVRQEDPGQWVEAEQLCLSVLDTLPRSHLAHTCLGVIYHRRHEYAVAEYHLKRTIELDPYDGNYVDLGALYVQLGRFAEAGHALGKALDRDWYDAQAHIESGNMYLQQDLDAAQATTSARQAVQHFRQALSINRSSAPAAIGLALALARSPGDLAAAERVLRDSVERADAGPPRAELLLALARLLIERGDATQGSGFYREALATAQQAIELAAANPEPYFVAGVATYKASESNADVRSRPFHRRRAVKYLRECVRRDPGHAEARRILLLAEESISAARGSVAGSIVLITVATALLSTLWAAFFLSHRVTSVVLASLTPVLVGLIALGFVLPFLVRLKLPGGVEADLSASLHQISSGPMGDVSVGPGRFGGRSGDAAAMGSFSVGPRGQLPRLE